VIGPAGRFVLVCNPRSGRGRAAAVSDEIVAGLRQSGRSVRVWDLDQAFAQDAAFREQLGKSDGLLIVGGDGTVHSLLCAASSAGVPIYHVPTGNENLFAREFGMDARWETLVRAIERGGRRSIDLGDCAGRAFALMTSFGFDAEVVGRVAGARTGGISHRDYFVRGVQSLRGVSWPPLRVEVDGRLIVNSEPGWLIVANSRQYAARLDPARAACVQDGLLDVLFLPARSVWSLSVWAVRMLAGMHLEHPQALHALGRDIVIDSPISPVAMQIDGEQAGRVNQARLTVRPGALRVMMPG
jgi:diacylglycerol kinase (ATP)